MCTSREETNAEKNVCIGLKGTVRSDRKLVIPLSSWNWGISMEELAELAPEGCKGSGNRTPFREEVMKRAEDKGGFNYRVRKM